MENPIHLYTSDDGHVRLQVALEQETVWLTQAQMAELFDKDVRTINEHIGNIYGEDELTPRQLSGNSGSFARKENAR